MFQTKECGDIHDIDLFIKNILINSIQKKSLSIDSLILIKPNCNSDMIALTGNTTDLRIIVSIIRRLKDLGYENIIIGDGTSSGFVNSHIDVLSRLGIKRLSEIFKIKYIDFNEAEFTDVPFLDTSIRIAKVCLEADFFVNNGQNIRTETFVCGDCPNGCEVTRIPIGDEVSYLYGQRYGKFILVGKTQKSERIL